MDEITHHLPDRLLMAYAAGALPEAFELVVAAHVSMCDECRARLGAFDAVGGTLLEETSGAALDEDSLDRTLRLIAEAEADKVRQSARRPPPALAICRSRCTPISAAAWPMCAGAASVAVSSTLCCR